MLDRKRLRVANMIQKAALPGLELPPRFPERSKAEQERWLDERLADVQLRVGESEVRQLLERHGLLPPPAPVIRPEITVRNLIYHVCPVGDWRENVDRVIQYQDAFNGRRIVAVAQGEGLEPIGDVEPCLRPLDAELWVLPNDRELREVATFLPLLIAIQNTEPNEATFYGHTKGNTTADSMEGARLWREVMYHELLRNWLPCMEELRTHSVVGTHKYLWPPHARPFPTELCPIHRWMCCGTFWWFRHDAAFTHPAWRKVPMDRYGAEAWPSMLFPHTEAKSMWQPWPEDESAWPQLSPYDPSMYDGIDYLT